MDKRHHLTRYSLLLAFGGLALNLALSRLALYFALPLYLDSAGTIVAAMLGGYLPGIMAGFFANLINGVSDPITLFYSIISVLIATAAANLARRGWFKKAGKTLLAVLVFTFIGGVLGSGLTWLLYGYDIGSGISAPYALMFYNSFGLPEFFAQLLADVMVDLADKVITVAFVLLLVKLLPASFMAHMPNITPAQSTEDDTEKRIVDIRRSLRSKVVLLISVFAIFMGVTATIIGFFLYERTMKSHYVSTATGVAEMAASVINGDSVDEWLTGGEETASYRSCEEQLQRLRNSVPDVEYLYVYQVREDGCHVVFDVDTPELEGGSLGDVIPVEGAFLPHMDALLKGESIPAVVSNGSYGWLLTVYAPIRNSAGKTVAYAAADISMDDVMSDRTVYFVKMGSLLFAVSIMLVSAALWLAERRLIDPINAMAEAADDFAFEDERERNDAIVRMHQLNIHTGDEIENLYEALDKTVSDVTHYIADISEKAKIITQLHRNIIISFATMVENRDLNTGQHIRRTASYVSTIASQMLLEGRYPEVINREYISTIVRSAPLHDLGKIKITDVVLNKPGKLTAEEFELIKTHTTAGKEIIEGIIASNSGDADYLGEAVNMAWAHHERWDGKGYPRGLKGEEIPLSARIMAVADVFDALISVRSYKPPFSVNEAYSIIVQGSGTQFDPVVAEAFVNARAAIIAALGE